MNPLEAIAWALVAMVFALTLFTDPGDQPPRRRR